nr:cellulase family glycosylhydrolase [uncultured Caldimonas sp.]
MDKPRRAGALRTVRQGFVATACVVVLVACGGGGGSSSHSDDGTTPPQQPARLTIDGTRLLGPDGQPVRLRGVNVNGVDADDIETIAGTFGMNTIRLRISFTPENRADTDSGFSDAYRQQIDQWVEAARARKVWMVLEMRANDSVSNDADFYDTTKTQACAKPTSCANFGYYLKAWRYLASRYKDTDYIAGYGLLAEPSANKTGRPDAHLVLVAFHRALMDEISTIDARTPFFIGPNYNYDTMEYVRDEHFTSFMPAYRNRLVYEVNFLTPKEWIQNGSWTLGADKRVYPFPDPVDGYDSLLQGGGDGDSMEKTYNARRVEDGNYQKTLSKGFIAWYLQWPLAFRERHQVPLYVDQFGASSEAQGQLAYEQDLIDFFEAHDLHWTRWSYNAAGPDGAGRTLLPPNEAAIGFYTALASRW